MTETNKDYIYVGRKKYSRPQAMIWADNPGTIVDGFHVPNGYEVGADLSGLEGGVNPEDLNQFIVLSDDNREPIKFKNTRIETKERMVNGRMRSYYIGDKLNVSTSWKNLCSRAYSRPPLFDIETGKPTNAAFTVDDGNAETDDENNRLNGIRVPSISGYDLYEKMQHTSDGGAGGSDMLDWYRNHSGSFWLYLAYDNFHNFGTDEAAYQNIGKYSEVIEVFFADFTYDVVKRGATNHDYWDISVDLEEV